MSWVRIWIHLVFCTKNRTPFLHTKDIRLKMFQHIKENTQAKEIWLDFITGYEEHAHCLISLGMNKTSVK
jgi:REP element-mobilizing transposase RayT